MSLTPVEQQKIEQFYSFDYPEQRGEWLAQMTDEGRASLYAALAQHEELNLDDIIGLPAPWRHEANFHLIGNDHEMMKIHPCGRSFAIGPVNPEQAPVHVENGTRGGKRQYLIFDGPKLLETRTAINCLLQYGQHAEYDANRGKLKQMTMEEVAQWHAEQGAKNKSKSKSK